MVSVCLATYNGEKYIKTQLLSILAQIGNGDEIIISDDGSSDKTINIINQICDPRIKIFYNQNHGLVHNFENALYHVKGDYIFLSDQDDEWMPNKVEVCLAYLQDYDCVVSDSYICDDNGEIIKDSFFSLNKTRRGKYYNLLIKSGYIGCCMAFRSVILPRVLPFPDDIPLHDMWIGNLASFKFRLTWSPNKLVKYRRHGNNASCAAEKSNYSLFDKIGFRWFIIKNLVKRWCE